MNFLSTLFFVLISISATLGQHVNGLTIVGTPSKFDVNPYPRIAQTEANWVCFVPYGFTRLEETSIHFNLEKQWWGEKKAGIIENIKLAKDQGMKIFLKPQIYIPGSWPGALDFTEEDWKTWESNYREFIEFYIDIAEQYEVDMFCIGTEFKISEQKRAFFWKSLIQEIRCDYSGLLTYSSNWDSYEKVGFWDDLDFIGISSYFPICTKSNPKNKDFDKAWKSKILDLEKYSKEKNRKILFTEYGYLSVEGCAGKTWELEKQVHQLEVNQEAQAKAFDALFRNLWDRNFWAGGFIWKWFPNDQGHEGYISKDYTPKDKLAEQVLKFWFSKDKMDVDG